MDPFSMMMMNPMAMAMMMGKGMMMMGKGGGMMGKGDMMSYDNSYGGKGAMFGGGKAGGGKGAGGGGNTNNEKHPNFKSKVCRRFMETGNATYTEQSI